MLCDAESILKHCVIFWGTSVVLKLNIFFPSFILPSWSAAKQSKNHRAHSTDYSVILVSIAQHMCGIIYILN